MIIGLCFLIVIYITISFWIAYNKIIDLKNSAEKAYVNIDILLMKRAELIPQLCKLEEYQVAQWQSIMEQFSLFTDSILSKKVSLCNQLIDLQENISMIEVNAELQQLNESIDHRISFYNESALLFNNCFSVFPHSYFINMLGMQPMPLLRKM